MRRTMRRLAVTAALTLSLGMTAACGDDEPAGGSGGSGGASAGAFPVTITHKLGTAKIESAPKRIVALGEVDQDALLALGITPVGMAELTGVQPDGLAPWTAPKLTGAKPKLLKAGEAGFNLEEIAALRPDLILAGGDFYIDKEYEKLSKLAPTVAYQTGPAEDAWQAITMQAAKAVGREADGRKLVGAADTGIAAVKTRHPELSGKEFAFTSIFPNGNIGVMKSPEDTSVKLLQQFGMKLPESIAKLPGEGFAAELSMEKVSALDVDVLISHYNDDPATQKKVEGNKLFASLDVVKRGSYVALDLKSFWPLRTPTVLAVPYVTDQVVPKIAKAAGAAKPA
ncbi:iron-siderophore ABC transporter substrate-binding protein [Actinomadura madurae]|uniref:iron-siderophore ABC transporter substrate-binding protein n=1 Tax=Actinomadura madurae TaxID=1993 RepID=UPI0020266C07|nr:iron-siderophore ABC transporter substrate-binding protein [Actinomadura madurae]URM92956.1 iron-siderophore ABC transporter substrate-binding protein [Actinomadura madurae]URN03687.1 iron-siderophore ABC transporter substrate-binding protein [Actinomadura madurae]